MALLPFLDLRLDYYFHMHCKKFSFLVYLLLQKKLLLFYLALRILVHPLSHKVPFKANKHIQFAVAHKNKGHTINPNVLEPQKGFIDRHCNSL